MKAASGVIHSEMPKQENGLMRGFQLWINLPAANKTDAPEHQEYKSDAFPVVEASDFTAKVIVGHLCTANSRIRDHVTNVCFFDVQVNAEKRFQYKLPKEENSFLFIFEGDGQFKGLNSPLHTFLQVGTEDTVSDFIGGEQGARFLLVSSNPNNEPIVQYGAFVMNSKKEIDQARRDYLSNNFVRNRAWVNRNKAQGYQ